MGKWLKPVDPNGAMGKLSQSRIFFFFRIFFLIKKKEVDPERRACRNIRHVVAGWCRHLFSQLTRRFATRSCLHSLSAVWISESRLCTSTVCWNYVQATSGNEDVGAVQSGQIWLSGKILNTSQKHKIEKPIKYVETAEKIDFA